MKKTGTSRHHFCKYKSALSHAIHLIKVLSVILCCLADDGFGLEMNDLRFLAGMGDTVEKDGEEFLADARLIHVEGRDLRIKGL